MAGPCPARQIHGEIGQAQTLARIEALIRGLGPRRNHMRKERRRRGGTGGAAGVMEKMPPRNRVPHERAPVVPKH
jgi:hypothetical protein